MKEKLGDVAETASPSITWRNVVMAFNIDEHDWYKCESCGGLFNENLMREVYDKRVQEQEDMLLKLAEGEPRDNAQKMMGNPPTCPYCPSQHVQKVLQLHPKSRQRLRRRARWLEVVEWLKARIPLWT